MKTLKVLFRCWAIFIAMILTFGLLSCVEDDEDLGLNPKPNPEPVVKDTLVIEVTLSTPENVTLSRAGIYFYNEKLKSYNKKLDYPGDYTILDGIDGEDVLFYRFVYYGAIADSMAGSTCIFSLGYLDGRNHDVPREFCVSEDSEKELVVHKGINKITLKIRLIPPAGYQEK